MLDTESTVMESNGNEHLPEIPAEDQALVWSTGQVSSGQLPNISPEGSDASQEAPGPEQMQMNSELGSVEKAVEQFQLANAPLFHGEHPPPPPPPPPTDEADQTAEPTAPQPGEFLQDDSQGKYLV